MYCGQIELMYSYLNLVFSEINRLVDIFAPCALRLSTFLSEIIRKKVYFVMYYLKIARKCDNVQILQGKAEEIF